MMPRVKHLIKWHVQLALDIRAVLKLTDYQKKEIRRQLNSRVLRLMGRHMTLVSVV